MTLEVLMRASIHVVPWSVASIVRPAENAVVSFAKGTGLFLFGRVEVIVLQFHPIFSMEVNRKVLMSTPKRIFAYQGPLFTRT